MSALGTGCRLALAVIATLLWTDNPAQEERGASRTYWLYIPSQPLEGALLDRIRPKRG